ncbi:MAG TPA: translocation/assembly module TamB domain-containing protein, partial [Candidatus Eisenbacteria bacterium]|nr:translocation/assembly module TamB domain-containing protein [Candidatus Eisenbacteria bacterium]
LGTSMRLDRIAAGLETIDGDPKVAPARIELDCSGPKLAVVLRGMIHRDNGVRVSTDTLSISASGKDLRSVRPFHVHALSEGQGFVLDDLDLKGTMGSVVGRGDLRPGASVLDFRAALDLGGLPVPARWRPEWWPEHLDASVRNEGASAVFAQATLTGLRLGGPGDYTLTATARGDATGLQANVDARGEGASLKAEMFAPGTWQLYPLRVQIAPNQLRSHVTVDKLPVPWSLLGIETGRIWPATLSGVMHLDHDDYGPFARADLDVTFVSSEENTRAIRFTTRGAWRVSADQMSRLGEAGNPLDAALASRLSGLTEPGCVVMFALSRTSEPELSGTLSAPFKKTPEGRYVLDPERGINLKASAQRLDLSSLNAFLPSGNQASGTVKLDFSVKGPPSDPSVGGHLDATRITLTTNDGGRVLGKGKLTCSGTLLAPRIEGRIDIENALIPIPEAPRKLHPVAGPALLWPSRTAALPDTTQLNANTATPVDSVTVRRFAPAYDLEIDVPSGVWIRGRNLNVELGGDLRLRQERGHPTVVGTLEARQGTLLFLGRSFQLEHGKVQFFGEDENNPNLDIRLETKVSSTDVYVAMTGTAREPKVELTSSPSMSEADIMSLLVMGKTADDLDGDQADLVAQRAKAIAATYGAAEFEKKMAGPLGVDMITLNPGAGPEGESSVIVGKYLNPKTLLKYEQALDSAAGFFVTLQYTLTETITLETIAGTWQSGGEISWSKDY